MSLICSLTCTCISNVIIFIEARKKKKNKTKTNKQLINTKFKHRTYRGERWFMPTSLYIFNSRIVYSICISNSYLV